jgi:signal transduction histidine kinase
VSIATDELQRLLFDRITDAVVLVDARSAGFPIIDANGAFRDFLTDPNRLVAGQPWVALFPCAEDQGVLDIFARVAASGEPFQARDFPYRSELAPDGLLDPDTLRYWDWQCLPLGSGFGAVERLVVILADVTDRQRQRRVRLLNHRIMSQVPLGVLVTTGIDHRAVLVSPRLARLGDQPAASIPGRPIFAALPALAGAGLAPLMAEVYASGKPLFAEEYTFQPDDGRDLAVWNLTILPLPGLDGATEGLMLLVADLTAQARAQRASDERAAAAQRRAGELEAVIASITDGIFLLDGAGRVVESNEAGLQLLGLASPVHTHRLLEVLVARDLAWDNGRPLHTGDALLVGAFGGQRGADNLVLVGPVAPGHGRRFFCLCATPVVGDEGLASGAVVLLRDITPQREAEQEKDAFLSLIAHRVKSPLTAIKGFAQLAQRATGAAGEPSERIARHLAVIEQQSDRISQLVDELSNANRLRKGTLQIEPVPCDLATIAREVVAAQQPDLPKHQIALTVADEPLPLHADPVLIAQVIGHLLQNAAKFSPDADRIELTLSRTDRSAHLTVRDRGIGIPTADLARIFERFYRASNGSALNTEGLGLGLYIDREVVARSGGTIRAESTLGEGSVLRVVLPLVGD